MIDIFNNKSLVMIDKNKYKFSCFRGKVEHSLVLDNKTKDIIFSGIDLVSVVQVNDDEFFVCFCDEKGKNGKLNTYKFQHLLYNREEKEVELKYEKQYKNVSNDGNINFINGVVVLDDDNVTTIYNYKNGKVLELEDFCLIDKQNFSGNSSLVGRLAIRDMDNLIINIDINRLEFDCFYSLMQNRYISLVSDEINDFKARFGMTLEKEVYKYIEYIEEFEEAYYMKKLSRVCKRLEKK